MALQSSGQISISDIATELSAGSTNLSLRSLSSTAGFTTPDAVSEFYGYSHATYSNSHYYQLTASSGNALLRTASTSPFNLSTSQDLSISVWVRQDSGGTANQILWDFSNNTGSTANRFFLQWQSSSNHLIARFRTGSSNFDLQWDLNDNSSVTGLNSGNWSSTNRGNVVDGNFCMITLTYDASQSSGATAFKCYWNASEMTTTTGSTSNSRSTSAVNHICLGNNAHNSTTSAGAFDGAMDEFKIYNDLLTSGEVSTIYNSGSIAASSETHSAQLQTEITFDTDTSDSNGDFPTATTDSGTRVSWT